MWRCRSSDVQFCFAFRKFGGVLVLVTGVFFFFFKLSSIVLEKFCSVVWVCMFFEELLICRWFEGITSLPLDASCLCYRCTLCLSQETIKTCSNDSSQLSLQSLRWFCDISLSTLESDSSLRIELSCCPCLKPTSCRTGCRSLGNVCNQPPQSVVI